MHGEQPHNLFYIAVMVAYCSASCSVMLEDAICVFHLIASILMSSFAVLAILGVFEGAFKRNDGKEGGVVLRTL